MKDIVRDTVSETELLRPRYAHCLFLHGGAPLEGAVRARLLALRATDQLLTKLGVPHQDHVRSETAFSDIKHFVRDLSIHHLSPERLEYISPMLEPTFRIRSFAEATDTKMTLLARENRLEVVAGHSVGALAALEAIALRIDKALSEGLDPNALPKNRPDLTLPNLLILMDPLLGGLTPLARKYLDILKQTDPKHAVPGLMEIFPDSEYLTALRALLTVYSDFLPPAVIIDSQVGPGWIACPFAAVPAAQFADITDKLRIPHESTRDDGMGFSGVDASIFPTGRYAVIRLLGLPHTETLKHAAPIMADIMHGGSVCGIPIETLFTLPPEKWPVIDKRAFLTSPKNKALGKAMELFFRGAAKLTPVYK